MDFTMDQAILEQVNPVFNTAKMTLFQLSGTGNRDAAAIAERLGLTHEQTQNSATSTALPEQVIAGTITMDIGIVVFSWWGPENSIHGALDSGTPWRGFLANVPPQCCAGLAWQHSLTAPSPL